MIKAILWDNDGVLVDTEMIFYQATRETLQSVGAELTIERFVEFSLIKGKGLCDYLKGEGVEIVECESLRARRNEKYAELLEKKARIIEGVSETLEKLSGRYKMGVVTSSRRDHFDIIHRATGIIKYFDFILTSDDYQNTKPDPEPYLLGLKKSGVRKDECIVIEDSARGLTAANSAGIKCLMIPTEISRPETYRGDYRLLESVWEVDSAINELNATI